MNDQSDRGDRDEPDGQGEDQSEGDERRDALRAAVERTLAVTADSAEGTRQRAQGLLDDVVRRGQEARDEVARRGEEATTRLAEAISDLRREDAEGLEELGARLEGVERRLAALEAATYPKPNSQVEGESTPQEPDDHRDSGG